MIYEDKEDYLKIEDNLKNKTTTKMNKDNLGWKTNFDERQPSMEDTLRWKTTFDGGQPLMEDTI